MTNRTEQGQIKPLIGVTAKHGDPEWVSRRMVNYLNALEQFGAQGIVLSPDAPAVFPDDITFYPDAQGRLPRAVLQRLNGLILSGGGDVDPSYFGAELAGANVQAIDIPRDELELTLSKQALAEDIPVFGICRGCQVLNVAAGGGMIQHFDGHRSPRENPLYHDVVITAGSQLHRIIGIDRLPANTYHHQGLDRATLAPSFTPSGTADPDSWLLEAIESPTHTWIIGVQWHPERLFELEDAHRCLWEDFVRTCRERMTG
jgi:putative glutamine amidotransferase